MQALVLEREARASTLSRRPVHKRPRHRSGARPLLRRSSTGTGLEQQPDVESTTLAGAKLQAVPNGLGAPRCREGWQMPAAGSHRRGLRVERRQARFQRVRVVVLALDERLAGHVVHTRRARRRKLLMVRAPAGGVDPAPRYPLHLREARAPSVKQVGSPQAKATTDWCPTAAAPLHTHLTRT